MSKELSHNYLGKFKECCICYSADKRIRKAASSGGALSSLLCYALKKNHITAVIHCGFDNSKPWLPKIRVSRSAADIKNNAGSKYLKTKAKDYISIINSLGKSEKIAVVGLPCTISALKKIYKEKKHKKPCYYFGLFCGWPMDIKGTEYLIKKLGLKKEEIKKISYRHGKFPGGFYAETATEKKQLEKHHYDFPNIMFFPKSCDGCSYYSSENADLSFGDCWIKGKKSYTTLIIRSEAGKKLFDSAIREKAIIAEAIRPEKIVKTHMHNLKLKKGKAAFPRLLRLLLRNRAARKLLPFSALSLIAKLRRKIKDKS